MSMRGSSASSEEPQNKAMHLTVGALATRTAPPAGDRRCYADSMGREGLTRTGNV